jgi:mannose-6-phosphate isomerase-like protein (cupin superfamily)
MDEVAFGLVDGPAYARHDARGSFEELVNTGRWESLVVGRMARGAVMGHHYHAHTVVFFYLLEGRSRIVTVDVVSRARRELEIAAGQGFVFRPSEARAIHHLEDVRFVMLKSHRFDPAAPDLIAHPVS